MADMAVDRRCVRPVGFDRNDIESVPLSRREIAARAR
jgi:hypothetical protein